MTQAPNPQFIYKITTRPVYEAAKAQGVLHGMPIDLADGYLHFSTADQLAETLSRHFAGQDDLVLMGVETGRVAPALKWEVSRGGALFPHLYAPLPLADVAWVETIAVADDGSCRLPEAVQ